MDQTPAAGISSSPNANNSEHEKDKVSKLHNQVDELRDVILT
jgi:hypothetical protein